MTWLRFLILILSFAAITNLTTGQSSKAETCRQLCGGRATVAMRYKMEYNRAMARARQEKKKEIGETMRFLKYVQTFIDRAQKAVRNISTTRRVELTDRLTRVPVIPRTPRRRLPLQFGPAINVAQTLGGPVVQYHLDAMGRLVPTVQMAQQVHIPQTIPASQSFILTSSGQLIQSPAPAPASQTFILTSSGQLIQSPAPAPANPTFILTSSGQLIQSPVPASVNHQPFILTSSGQLIQSPAPAPANPTFILTSSGQLIQSPAPAPAMSAAVSQPFILSQSGQLIQTPAPFSVPVPFVRSRARSRRERPVQVSTKKMVMERQDSELVKYKEFQMATWQHVANWMKGIQRAAEQRARKPIVPVVMKIIVPSPPFRPLPPTPPNWMVEQLEDYFYGNPFAEPVRVQLGNRIYYVSSSRSYTGGLLLNFTS